MNINNTNKNIKKHNIIKSSNINNDNFLKKLMISNDYVNKRIKILKKKKIMKIKYIV